jgi:tetratricopeptide (TPR) repeat protein
MSLYNSVRFGCVVRHTIIWTALGLVQLAIGQVSEPAKKVAVIVGISKYIVPEADRAEPIDSLVYCHTDAKLIGKQLDALGWRTILLISPGTAVTATDIKNAIGALSLNPQDTFMFMYIGHGVRDNSEDYLVPSNAYIEKASGRAGLRINPKSLVSFTQLESWLGKVQAAKRILVLNMCRSAPGNKIRVMQVGAQDNDSSPQVDEAAYRTKLQKMGLSMTSPMPVSAVVIYSCRPDESSYEDNLNGCTVFGRAFASSLISLDSVQNGTNTIRADLLLSAIRREVANWQMREDVRRHGVTMNPNAISVEDAGPVEIGKGPDREYNYEYDNGLKALKSGEEKLLAKNTAEAQEFFLEAIVRFKAAFLRQPNADLAYTISKCNFHLKKYDAAEVWTNKALEVNPAFGQAAFSLGFRFFSNGMHDKALTWFSKALAINRNWAGAATYAGLSALALRKLTEAEHYLLTAVTVDAEASDAYNGLAKVLMARGQWTEAEARVRNAIKISSKNSGYHANLCKILYKQGRREEAKEAGNEAKSLGYRGDLPV